MRIFTCTPVAFGGGPDFFARDSGLLCRGLQAIGVESRAVMPGERKPEDEGDLIRTEYRNLESAEWWRSHHLDGVVLYAWGMPKYTNIARAIHEAGIILISNIDSSGLMSPYRAFPEYLKLILSSKMARHGRFFGIFLSFAIVCRHIGPFGYDRKRMCNLSYSDSVAMVTPQGSEILKNLAIRLKFSNVSRRVFYLPHPQLSIYRYDGTQKENILLSVGRWSKKDWFQKNPILLIEAAEHFLSRRPDYRFLIVGNSSEQLLPLIDKMHPDVKNRIRLIEHIGSKQLRDLYLRAKIGYWSSRHEGQQGSGAQALCCGCSVVATGGVAMNCFAHYTSRASGMQALRNDPEFLAEALWLESIAWDESHRNPEKISEAWCSEFHDVHVARRIMRIVSEINFDSGKRTTTGKPDRKERE